jgi:hypothetical protein
MPVGSLIPALTRPVFRRKSPAGAQLLADWPGVVGPALSAVTSPLRLSAGTLTIACAGPVAMELQHLAPELIGRINGHVGRVAVERLRFVQQSLPHRPPPAPPPAPDRPLPGAVQDRLAALPEGELRLGPGKPRPRRLSNPLRRGPPSPPHPCPVGGCLDAPPPFFPRLRRAGLVLPGVARSQDADPRLAERPAGSRTRRPRSSSISR